MWIIICLFTWSISTLASPLERAYDQVTFLTSHNAFNYAYRTKEKKFGPKAYVLPNQKYPVARQLKDGVRALMLDLHMYTGPQKKFKGQVILCHGGKGCDFLGMEPALGVMQEIRQFLVAHPAAVVTLILESYITTEALQKLLETSGLVTYLHQQDPIAPWPTIKRMIESNQRLVIFNDRIEPNNPAWNHDLFGIFAVETDYSYRSIKKFSCRLNRGDSSHSLFILNHFITRISGSPLSAKKANQYHRLIQRIKQCEQATGKRPNFLTLDFMHYGSGLKITEELNQGPLP